MAENTYRTIKIKKHLDIQDEGVVKTGKTVYPGMLLKLASDGTYEPHDTAGGNCEKAFAVENELCGGSIDDEYTGGDAIQIWFAGPGEVVNAILKDGESVAPGDYLESAADGYLQRAVAEAASYATYPSSVVGVSLETLDLSGESGSSAEEDQEGTLGYNKRLLVRIV